MKRIHKLASRLIDAEVKQVLSEAHSQTCNSLLAHRADLEELAKLLLEREVVAITALAGMATLRGGMID